MRAIVVIPTYNEVGNVARVLRRVRLAAPTADILVIDDASPDGTARVARALAAELGRIEVRVRPGKMGLASAYCDAFLDGIRRGYQVLVEMDGDLSHDPAAMPALLAAIEAGADLAVGSRYVPGSAIPRWSTFRRALSRWGNRYARWTLALPLADATSGFRAYRATVLKRVDLRRMRAGGYGFQIEMAYRVARVGGAIVEVPIEFADREFGTSKMSARIVAEALILVTCWGLRDLAEPLRARSRSFLEAARGRSVSWGRSNWRMKPAPSSPAGGRREPRGDGSSTDSSPPITSSGPVHTSQQGATAPRSRTHAI